MPVGNQRLDMRQLTVLDSILAAQEGNVPWFPSYADALAEIRRGCKMSCWMWYVWPSLSLVRKTRFPSLLLRSLDEARHYLSHEVLGKRLLEITVEATKKIVQDNIPPKILFGSIDSVKFHETCTLFAFAASANEDEDSAKIFLEALLPFDGPNKTMVLALLDDEEPGLTAHRQKPHIEAMFHKLGEDGSKKIDKKEKQKRRIQNPHFKVQRDKLDSFLSKKRLTQGNNGPHHQNINSLLK